MDDVKHPVHHVACGVHPDDSNRMIDIIVIDVRISLRTSVDSPLTNLHLQ